MRKSQHFFILVMLVLAVACTSSNTPSSHPSKGVSAVIFNMADMHSGYDAYPILLDNIDAYLQINAADTIVFAINGDFFEAGSVVAQRSSGKLDIAFLQQLTERGQVVFNIGNHDFDVIAMNDFIAQAKAIGVNIIGTFASSQLLNPLPAYTDIMVNQQQLRFIGVDTDHSRTFPAALRASLNIPVPQAWLKSHYQTLAKDADYTVLMSHAGLIADKAMLQYLGSQAKKPLYLTGAHDHLSLQTNINGIPYLHTAFKGQRLVVTSLQLDKDAPSISIDTLETDFKQKGNQGFAHQINATRQQVLDNNDTQIVGNVSTNMSLTEAVDWTLNTMLAATGADVALFNHSSFGSGLPRGPLAEYRFNQFMRFENKLVTATVDGITLEKILARANQHQQKDFDKLSGDFVYANAFKPETNKSYTLVTTDWVAMPDNQLNYLGTSLPLSTVDGLTIKTLLKQALSQNK